jgi:hypothetical protein
MFLFYAIADTINFYDFSVRECATTAIQPEFSVPQWDEYKFSATIIYSIS